MGGGRQAGPVDNVLERKGDAMQGPAPVAGGKVAFGYPRGRQGEIRRDPNEGVKAWVQPLDTIEQGLGIGDGGELARAQALGRRGDGQEGKIAHGALTAHSWADRPRGGAGER